MIQRHTQLFDPRLALFLVLFATMVLSAEVFTVFAALIYVVYAIFSPLPANKLAWRMTAPFLLLGVMGYLMSAGNTPYEVGKDAWYIAKLCLTIALGILLGVRLQRLEGLAPLLFLLAWAGVILTLIVLPLLPQGIPVIGRAEELPKLPLICLAAAPLALERIRLSRGHFLWRDVFFLVALGATAIVSDSRTVLVAFVLMVTAWAGVFSDMRRAVVGFVALSLVGLALWQILPEPQGGELTTLMKLRRSLEEVMFTDAYDRKSMIWNWRGFEAYNAQLMFDNGPVWNKLFGFGLGAEVDLGESIEVGENIRYQYLPNLHNGFYYVLIKFGAIGLIVYTLAVFRWFGWALVNRKRAHSLEVRLLRGLVLVVLASTAVITGLFNKDQMHAVTVLIALLLGHLHLRSAYSAAGARAHQKQAGSDLQAASQ